VKLTDNNDSQDLLPQNKAGLNLSTDSIIIEGNEIDEDPMSARNASLL